MKMIARQKIWLAIVLTANVLLWAIPSDVVECIARGQHVLVGRYSRTHFYWIVAVLLISIVSLYVDWSTGATYRMRWFQVVAVLMFGIPTVIAVDFLLRTPDVEHYIRDRIAYHRPPHQEFRGEFVDRPEAARSYPNAPPGYPAIGRTLRTDRFGFRNAVDAESCDIVALGDSFAEGSGVSDEHPWPVRLAVMSGRTVCNLGMSGYDPLHYLESLMEAGLPRRPRMVLCMIYEGNDFRSAKSDEKRRNPGFTEKWQEYAERSPLRRSLDSMFIRVFSSIGKDWPVPDAARISWLPIALPTGPGAKHYAFEPKQLRDLLSTGEQFAADKHWLHPRGQLAEMNRLCRDAGCPFMVILAPTKAHVLMPAVADRLPPADVRDFTAISFSGELPEATQMVKTLVDRADAKEQVIRQWCERESIPFFSVTSSLRSAMVAGVQTYFTYDQHWTPEGHEVVARAIHEFLRDRLLGEAPGSPPTN